MDYERIYKTQDLVLVTTTGGTFRTVEGFNTLIVFSKIIRYTRFNSFGVFILWRIYGE